eukprot:847495-Pleurochrysis_carterae.AAC.1
MWPGGRTCRIAFCSSLLTLATAVLSFWSKLVRLLHLGSRVQLDYEAMKNAMDLQSARRSLSTSIRCSCPPQAATTTPNTAAMCVSAPEIVQRTTSPHL